MVTTYSIDGLRLDSVREVDTAFWTNFKQSAGVYMLGEVDDGIPSYVCSYQGSVPGVFNYAS